LSDRRRRPTRLAVKLHRPPTCRRDASPRPNTAEHGASPPCPRTSPCAAPSRTGQYSPSRQTAVCKTSISGSTPLAASNAFLLHTAISRGRDGSLGSSPEAQMPTFGRRDAAAGGGTDGHSEARNGTTLGVVVEETRRSDSDLRRERQSRITASAGRPVARPGTSMNEGDL
jgi:hypothetical protein